ncbi:MAG: type II toxin-antitoxin system RelE/ParE family toxin [Nostoc sp.]
MRGGGWGWGSCTSLNREPLYAHIKPSLRGLPLDGYVILYQVIDDGVKILRVVSARQDLESLFAESDEE